MSNNVSSADYQQGSPLYVRWAYDDPSETTRRTPSCKEMRAYLQGALHDATLNKGKLYRFSQKDKKWLCLIKFLLKHLGYNSWIYKEGASRDVYVLETLAGFLDFAFDPTKLKSKKEKSAYIRGFFDAEGGAPSDISAKFYIQLAQKNRRKIENLKFILNSLGISVGKIHNPSKKVDPDYWRIFISTKSHKDFIKVIWSWHPKKQDIFARRMKI